MDNDKPTKPTSVYFAALTTDKLLPELDKRFSDYRGFLSRTGILHRVKKSFNYYYGFSDKGNFTSSDVASGGKGGALKLIKVNHFRNLIQHVVTLTTGQRPALRTTAANTDSETMIQTILGDELLEHYVRDKRAEKHLKQATEACVVLLEGYVVTDWDTEAGAEYGFEPEVDELGQSVLDESGQPKGKVLREGDVKLSNHHILNICRDFNRQDGDNDWVIIETYQNKHDLAAQYPEKKAKILECKATAEDANFKLWTPGAVTEDSDLVPVRQFRHRCTAAMPEGRLVVYLNKETFLIDTPFPYENLPGGLGVYRIAPGDFIGTGFGYSPAMDVLSIQETLDALYSVIVTNQTTFGVQNIMAPSGHNISYTQLADGLNLIEYNKMLGPPEALELCKTPVEIFNFIPTLVSDMRIMMGLNDVIMGDPQASLKSGSALALIAAQAVQFNYELQRGWAMLLEDVGLAILKLLQQNAKTKRVAAIVGKHNVAYIREFMGTDLNQINRVTVDIENPLSKTPAGRLEQANNLLNAQAVDADQYLMVVKTGKLESMTESKITSAVLIRRENEALRTGKPVKCLITDLHDKHLPEHLSLLDSPEARENDMLAQGILTHVMEHINQLTTGNPMLLQLRGQVSLAPPPMPVGPNGGEPTPPGTGTPQATGESPTNGRLPSQPKMPSNPAQGGGQEQNGGGEPGPMG